MTPSIGRVIRYWCSIGTTGISTPASRPSSCAQIPAAFTTTSASIEPWSVTTPVTRPSRTGISTTRTPVRIRAPPRLAPSANAIVRPVGSRCPSVGTNCAPNTFETSSSGNRSSASEAETISTGRPKLLAHPACRASASSRYGEDARCNVPTWCHPTSTPVSASSSGYSSTPSIIIRVWLTEFRSWATRPAEWNVDPLVSSERSRSRTSFQPSFVRW